MQNFFTKLDSPSGGPGGVSAPPSQSNPDDSAPWWLRYAAKAAGVIGGVGEYKSCLIFAFRVYLMVTYPYFVSSKPLFFVQSAKSI